MVALLASPAAAYVTGASWPVDGGMLMMGPQANTLTSHTGGRSRDDVTAPRGRAVPERHRPPGRAGTHAASLPRRVVAHPPVVATGTVQSRILQ